MLKCGRDSSLVVWVFCRKVNDQEMVFGGLPEVDRRRILEINEFAGWCGYLFVVMERAVG